MWMIGRSNESLWIFSQIIVQHHTRKNKQLEATLFWWKEKKRCSPWCMTMFIVLSLNKILSHDSLKNIQIKFILTSTPKRQCNNEPILPLMGFKTRFFYQDRPSSPLKRSHHKNPRFGTAERYISAKWQHVSMSEKKNERLQSLQ